MYTCEIIVLLKYSVLLCNFCRILYLEFRLYLLQYCQPCVVFGFVFFFFAARGLLDVPLGSSWAFVTFGF